MTTKLSIYHRYNVTATERRLIREAYDICKNAKHNLTACIVGRQDWEIKFDFERGIAKCRKEYFGIGETLAEAKRHYETEILPIIDEREDLACRSVCLGIDNTDVQERHASAWNRGVLAPIIR